MFGIKKFLRIKKCINMGVKLGDNIELGNNIFWGSEPYLISIGSDTRISNNVKFITHDGGLWVLRNLNKLENSDYIAPINIGKNVNIGMNVAIMPGVNIGDNCVIGYGAVVTKDIPSNSVAVGIPAKVIETIDEYYEKKKNKVDYTKNMKSSEKKIYLINKWNGQ